MSQGYYDESETGWAESSNPYTSTAGYPSGVASRPYASGSGSDLFSRGSTDIYGGGAAGSAAAVAASRTASLQRAATSRIDPSGGLDVFLGARGTPSQQQQQQSQQQQSQHAAQQQMEDNISMSGSSHNTNNNNSSGGNRNSHLHESSASASLDPYPSLRPDQAQFAQSQQVGSSLSSRLTRRTMMDQKPDLMESAPMPPITDAIEANLPRPKISRRYQRYTRGVPREPDLARAKVVKNARVNKHGNDEGQHVLTCPNCRHFLKIPKSAVLMHCPTCSTVSPASSSNNQ